MAQRPVDASCRSVSSLAPLSRGKARNINLDVGEARSHCIAPLPTHRPLR